MKVIKTTQTKVRQIVILSCMFMVGVTLLLATWLYPAKTKIVNHNVVVPVIKVVPGPTTVLTRGVPALVPNLAPKPTNKPKAPVTTTKPSRPVVNVQAKPAVTSPATTNPTQPPSPTQPAAPKACLANVLDNCISPITLPHIP